MSKQLEGTWHVKGGFSSIVYVIEAKGKRLTVRAMDYDDGETVRVSGLKTVGRWLEFKTFVKSSGFRASHRIRLLSRNKVQQIITYAETWIRSKPGMDPRASS